MKKYFTGDFYKFLFAFLVIIVIAFSVIIIAAKESPAPVDNIAQPQ